MFLEAYLQYTKIFKQKIVKVLKVKWKWNLTAYAWWDLTDLHVKLKKKIVVGKILYLLKIKLKRIRIRAKTDTDPDQHKSAADPQHW